jgi:hypothetical protein
MRYIAAILVALAAAMSVFLALLPLPCHPEKQAGSSQANEQYTKKGCPSAISAIFVPVGDFVHIYKEEIGAASGALLTFITAGLVWVGYRQIVTSRAQLRAYVYVHSARVINAAEGEGPLIAHVVIKNFGETPARRVTNVSGFAIDRYPLPETVILTINDHEFSAPNRSRSDLAPTQAEEMIDVARRPPLAAHERQALIDGEVVIVLYGEIRFLDVFGRKQWKTYRMMLGGPVGVRPGGSLVACDDGNDAS